METIEEVKFNSLEMHDEKKRSVNSSRTFALPSLRGSRLFAKDGKDLYYYDIDFDRGKLKQLSHADDNCIANVFCFGEYPYWMDSDKCLRRGTLSGGELHTLVAVDNDCTAFDIGATPKRMYWNGAADKRLRMGVDNYTNPHGGKLECCVAYKTDWEFEYVTADGDYVFGANPGSDYVAMYHATDTDLNFIRNVQAVGMNIQYLTASDGMLMWFQRSHNRLAWIDYRPFI